MKYRHCWIFDYCISPLTLRRLQWNFAVLLTDSPTLTIGPSVFYDPFHFSVYYCSRWTFITKLKFWHQTVVEFRRGCCHWQWFVLHIAYHTGQRQIQVDHVLNFWSHFQLHACKLFTFVCYRYWYDLLITTVDSISYVKHALTSEVMWQYCWWFCSLLVLLEWPLITWYSHIHSKYDFWHDFAGKGVLNVLGGVPPKWFLPF